MSIPVRQLIIDHIRANPRLTIRDIIEGAAPDAAVMDIEIAEVVSGNAYGTVVDCEMDAVVLSSGPLNTPAVLTRTKAQREAFDRHVLAVLCQLGDVESLPSESLVELTGHPTTNQLRKSLHRLWGADLVEITGRARGTRYSPTGDGRKAGA